MSKAVKTVAIQTVVFLHHFALLHAVAEIIAGKSSTYFHFFHYRQKHSAIKRLAMGGAE
jgi:hypothetical protein